MKTLLSCEFNIDTACVELNYSNGSIISINCTAVEDEVANNRLRIGEYLVLRETKTGWLCTTP